MMIPKAFRGTRVASIFWLAVSLGSCAYVETVNHTTATNITYTLTPLMAEPHSMPHQHCPAFQRSPRLGHVRPVPPKIDISKLDDAMRTEVLLSYAERLKQYIDDEERFLQEDMLHHSQNCKSSSSDVFQKGSGI